MYIVRSNEIAGDKLLELKMSVKVIPFGLFQMIAFCSLYIVKDIMHVGI